MRSNAERLIKYGFHWLLLAVNSIGVTGAMLEVLEVPWRKFPPGAAAVLFGALFCFCGIGALFRMGRSGRKVAFGLCCFAVLYLLLGLLWRDVLAESAWITLKNAVDNLNKRYQFHIVWPKPVSDWNTTGQDSNVMIFGILYVLLPMELLAGYIGRYDRGFCLIVGNGLWLTAACACDLFPGYFFLALCVMGAAGTLTQRDFGENPAAGAAVGTGMMALTGIVMAFSYSVLLPLMDVQYEIWEEARGDFYRIVNEDWIPRVKSMLPGGGFGPGVDVTGRLGRSDFFAYTGTDAYRVTVDRKPQGVLYLKGFVGGTYVGAAWEDFPDFFLEDYYENAGMELPGHYSDLVNIGYEAAGALARWAEPGYISIEELGGQGSYAIYPYGAQLSEEERVRGDTSVERRRREYGFQYYFLSGFNTGIVLPEEVRSTEERYRKYVYDSFLEYPRELTALTEALEGAEIRTDSVYHCIMDLMDFLDKEAEYDLDTENPPPGADFVEYFLFQSHRGYCMHFASAAVLSLRYFGIPARYVTGYTVSPSDFSGKEDGGYTAVLTGKQAHAWAEIYLDSIGWVPVEMTPGAVALPEDNRMEMAAQIRQLTGENLVMAGNEDAWRQDRTDWQHGEDNDREGTSGGSREPLYGLEEMTDGQEESLSAQTDKRTEFPTVTQETAGEEPVQERFEPKEGSEASWGKLTMILLWAGTAAVLSVVYVLYRMRRRSRAEAFGRAQPREKIFLLYRNLRTVLHIAGCPRSLALDGEVFRRILEERFSVSEEEYTLFCNILEKSSFGREEPREEELQAVYAMRDRLLKGAWEEAPFYKKVLIGRFRHCI